MMQKSAPWQNRSILEAIKRSDAVLKASDEGIDGLIYAIDSAVWDRSEFAAGPGK